MTKIKICGLRRPEDVNMMNRLKPDYVGFILAEGRRRTISPETAQSLHAGLDPSIASVGVFVNQEPDRILELAGKGIFEAIQLHGQEGPETVRYLKERCGLPIFKALSVRDGSEADEWQESGVDYLLLDNGIGGTGETFDWSCYGRIPKNIPLWIAGGLNEDNVPEVLTGLAPYGIDVSGGVETDGYKDEKKAARLIACVRNHDENKK